MSEKFTKGPWKVQDDGMTLGVRIKKGLGVLIGRFNAQNKANANLIAAAPENYYANKMIEEKLKIGSKIHGGEYMITLSQSEVDQLRSALDKARGETK